MPPARVAVSARLALAVVLFQFAPDRVAALLVRGLLVENTRKSASKALSDGEARTLRDLIVAGDAAAERLRAVDALPAATVQADRLERRRESETLMSAVQAGEDATVRMMESVRSFAFKTAHRLTIPTFCRHLLDVDALAGRGLMAALDAARKWEPGLGSWSQYACGRVHAYMLVELKAAIASALNVPVMRAFDYARAVSAVNGGADVSAVAAGLDVPVGVLVGVLGRSIPAVDVDCESAVLAAGGSVACDGGVSAVDTRSSPDVLGFSAVEWEAVCSLAAGEPASMSAVGRSRSSVLRGLRDRGMIA